MKSIQDCPVCGTSLLVVGKNLVTLEEAHEMEMEARYERREEIREKGTEED